MCGLLVLPACCVIVCLIDSLRYSRHIEIYARHGNNDNKGINNNNYPLTDVPR